MKKQLGRFVSQVYRIILANPMSTSGEIFAIYKSLNPDTIRSRNEVAKRVSELVKWGLVEYIAPAVCAFSGKNAKTVKAIKGGAAGYVLSDKSAEKQPVETCSDEECSNCTKCTCGCEDDNDDDDCAWDNPSESFCKECEDYDTCDAYDNCEPCKNDCASCEGDEEPEQLDDEDLAILRQIRLELEGLDRNPLFSAAVHLVPGLSEKAKKLKKALRLF